MNVLNKWKRPFASTYFRSAGSCLASKIAVFGLAGLASQYLLTHSLSRDSYGLVIWAGTVIAFISPLWLPGITNSIPGAVAKGFDGNFRVGTRLEFFGGLAGGVLLFAGAGYYWFYGHSAEKALIFVIAGLVSPGIWLDTQQAYWNGKKDFKALSRWAITTRMVQLSALAVVLFFTASPVLAFGSQIIIQSFSNLFSVYFLISSPGVGSECSSEYTRFGWYSTWLYFLGTAAAYCDKLIIGLFFGLEQLAVFAVGELIYSFFYKTPASFLAQIFMPRLAEMPLADAARWIRRRQPYLVAGTACVVLVIAMAVPLFYPLLFSPKYRDSIVYAYLFLGCIVLGAPSFLCGALLRSHAMQKETKESWMILTLAPLALVPLFGWWTGLAGIVLARGMTNMLISIYYSLMIRRISRTS